MKDFTSPCFRFAAILALVLVLSGCTNLPASADKAAAAPTPAVSLAMPVETLVAPLPATTADGFVQSTTTAAPPGPRPNPDTIPVIQRGTDNRHASFLARIQQGPIDVLFLGDSITDFWNTRGSAVWDQYYGKLNAANFGINADKTQNVLWRLQNGEGQGFSPKVVVLMIGTNNVGVTTRRTPASPWRGTNMEAIAGVTAVVAELRKDFPSAKILLLGIFPRGDDLLAMQQIPEVNRGIARLDDRQHVFYLDITAKFLGPDGQINLDYFQAADHLHPNAAGYAVWAEAIKEPLAELLK
jgi:lysophospholipase L1-like esterase